MLTTVYGAVKVDDKELERHGQVGVYLGEAAPGESVVKFDGDKNGEYDTFADSSLVVL